MHIERRWLLLQMGCVGAAAHAPARAAENVAVLGELKTLGNDRFQIGRVVIDKRARSFVVPGQVRALGKPLEYLATSRGGRKSYEALFELDASGSELNVACLLIGLERDPDLPTWKPPHLGKRVGPLVRLSVAWTDAGKRQQISAAEALMNAEFKPKAEKFEWAYTGSFTSMDGSLFAADKTGTLIPFIQDPSGVIEAVSGSELGPYGAVRGNPMLPPEGSPMELIVEAAVRGAK